MNMLYCALHFNFVGDFSQTVFSSFQFLKGNLASVPSLGIFGIKQGQTTTLGATFLTRYKKCVSSPLLTFLADLSTKEMQETEPIYSSLTKKARTFNQFSDSKARAAHPPQLLTD